jgi:hypothetical protein
MCRIRLLITLKVCTAAEARCMRIMQPITRYNEAYLSLKGNSSAKWIVTYIKYSPGTVIEVADQTSEIGVVVSFKFYEGMG